MKKPSPACHELGIGETTIFVSVILLKHLILEYVIFFLVGMVFFVFLHAKASLAPIPGSTFSIAILSFFSRHGHTWKKRVLWRRWLFWQKKLAEKVRKSRQNLA